MSNKFSYTQLCSKFGPQPLPKRLEFGDQVEVFFDLPELEKAIAEQQKANVMPTRAFVRDAEGKEYTSRLPKILAVRRTDRIF